MAKKTTKAQRVRRVRIIYELLLTDTPRADIVQYCYQTWGVSPKTADNYVKAANELIAQEAARMRENALEKHLAQRALIRNKALKGGDQRLAFDVLRDETKLLDLYPSAKHEVTGAEGAPIKVIRVASDDLDWDSDDE
jgi:hypothetical protein